MNRASNAYMQYMYTYICLVEWQARERSSLPERRDKCGKIESTHTHIMHACIYIYLHGCGGEIKKSVLFV